MVSLFAQPKYRSPLLGPWSLTWHGWLQLLVSLSFASRPENSLWLVAGSDGHVPCAPSACGVWKALRAPVLSRRPPSSSAGAGRESRCGPWRHLGCAAQHVGVVLSAAFLTLSGGLKFCFWTSLMVQWLRLHASTAGGTGLILGWESSTCRGGAADR